MRGVSVVVVGAGGMGAAHAEALSRIPGVSIAAVAATDFRAARELAGRHGARHFRSHAGAFSAVRADAAWVCAPTSCHHLVTLDALRRGMHVFCEKPMAAGLREAGQMAAAARETGKLLMIGHVLRFFPDFRRLHSLVRNGDLGRPAVVRTTRGGGFPPGYRNWYRSSSGGPLLDLVIHDFDWLLWTFGPVIRVHSRAVSRGGNDPMAYTLTLLRHRQGTISHVEGYWGHRLPFRVMAEVAGSSALADYDSAHPVVFAVEGRPASGNTAHAAVLESPLAKSPYQLEDEHFIECIRTGQRPSMTPDDALAALRVSLAAIRSARTGRPVAP